MTREENREPVWDKRPQAHDEVARNQDEREQADLIKKFLESNVLAVDIFALRREATGESSLIRCPEVILRSGKATSSAGISRAAACSYPHHKGMGQH